MYMVGKEKYNITILASRLHGLGDDSMYRGAPPVTDNIILSILGPNDF